MEGKTGSDRSEDVSRIEKRLRWTGWMTVLLLVLTTEVVGFHVLQDSLRRRLEHLEQEALLLRDRIGFVAGEALHRTQFFREAGERLFRFQLPENPSPTGRTAPPIPASSTGAPGDTLAPELRDRQGAVFLNPATTGHAPALSEIGIATELSRLMGDAHRAAPLFSSSTFYSATGDLVAMYPGRSLQEVLNATRTSSLSEAWTALAAAGETHPLTLAGPGENPERRTRWSTAHRPLEGSRWGVSCLAPLYPDDRFRGVVGIDIPGELFTRLFMTPSASIARFALVEPGNSVLATSTPLWEDTALPGEHARMPSDASVPDTSSWRRFPVEGTPWIVAFQENRGLLWMDILGQNRWFLLLVTLLVVLILGFWIALERALILPALAMMRFIDTLTVGERPPIPPIPRFWRSCFVEVARTVRERRESLEALHAHEQAYRHIFNATNEAILIHDVGTGAVVDANEGLTRLLGFGPERFSQMTLKDLSEGIPPFSEHEALQHIARALREGPQVFEWHARCQDGTLRWVEVALRWAEIGGTARILAVVRDIADRRAAERAQRLIHYAFDQTQDEIFWLNSTAHFEAVNRRACEALGYTREELLTLSIHDVDPDFPPKAWPPHLAQLRRKGSLTFESRHRKKDGETYPVEVTGLHIVFEGQEGSFSFARDISKRKQAEIVLRESEERYRTMVDLSPHAVTLTDLSGKILFINKVGAHLHGFQDPAEMIGLPSRDFVDPEDWELLNTLFPGAPSREVLKDHPCRLRRRDGSVFPALLSIAPVLGEDGMPRQYLSLPQDITERCRAEETIAQQMRDLESKNAEMERFTYTVSHDLKSPLITIKGFLASILPDARGGRMERLESDVRRIANAADKMQALLEDLLTLSRVGRVGNPPTRFPMYQPLREALELLEGPLNDRHVRMVVAEDMPDVVADGPRIREVWQNLVENALKYMGDQTEPRIEVGWQGSSEDPVFFVRDNGIGIDPAYHEKIFGLFDKLDPSTEGTGIGLALVRRILEHHRGEIWVASEGQGRGTTFFFSLGSP